MKDWFYNLLEYLLSPERCENCESRIFGGNREVTDDDVVLCLNCFNVLFRTEN